MNCKAICGINGCHFRWSGFAVLITGLTFSFLDLAKKINRTNRSPIFLALVSALNFGQSSVTYY